MEILYTLRQTTEVFVTYLKVAYEYLKQIVLTQEYMLVNLNAFLRISNPLIYTVFHSMIHLQLKIQKRSSSVSTLIA